MTAAASKYSGTMPFILNASGNSAGNSRPARLNKYAAPVPIPIRLNMLRFHVLNDTHARTKNGQPPHSTTGVASTACPQLNAFALSR